MAFKTSSLTAKAREKVEWALDGEYGGCPREVKISILPRAIAINGKRGALPKKAPSGPLGVIQENLLDSFKKTLEK